MSGYHLSVSEYISPRLLNVLQINGTQLGPGRVISQVSDDKRAIHFAVEIKLRDKKGVKVSTSLLTN